MSRITVLSQPTRLQFCHELEILIQWIIYFLKESHMKWPSQIKSVSLILHSLSILQMLKQINIVTQLSQLFLFLCKADKYQKGENCNLTGEAAERAAKKRE